jgi:hypothetical protein
MRKILGVGAVLLLAGALAAPANAAPVAADIPSAVAFTVAVEASPDAVVDFESPVVATEAAPEPVVEPVAPVEQPVLFPVPVEAVAPTTEPVAAETGGTVEEPTVEPAPVVEEPPAATVEPTPVVEPAPVEVVAPTPTTEESEVQSPITVTDSPEYAEGREYLLPGETYKGSYVGDSSAWIAEGDRVVVSPTIRKVDPEVGPLGKTLDVFHVYSKADEVAPTEPTVEGDGS